MILSGHLKKFFVCAIIIATILIYSTPFFSQEAGQALFVRKGYYLILALTALWAFQLVLCLEGCKPNIRLFCSNNFYRFIFCFLACSLIFLASPPYFRVLPDEINLLSVSQSMAYSRNVDNVISAYWIRQQFQPLLSAIPFRPLLFPFFISIFHIFTGFRPENVFVLNFFVLLVGLLLIVSQATKYTGSRVWAVVAVLLVLAQPIVTQTATSGGFDLLAVVFLGIVLINLVWFMREPQALRFELLWLNLLMLANIRYESILFFPLVMCLLWARGYIKRELFSGRSGFLYWLTPLFLFLLFYPRVTCKDGLGQLAYGAPSFSVAYMPTNIKALFQYFFELGVIYPYAGIVNIIGVIALIFFACRRRPDGSKSYKLRRNYILIAGACILASLLVHLFYFWGKAGHPSTSRLFLLYAVTLSLFTAAFFYQIPEFRRKPAAALFLAVILFVIYRPSLVNDYFSLQQKLPFEYRIVKKFLDQESKKGSNFIVISNHPNLYSALNYAAMDIKNKANLELAARSLGTHAARDIFVVQSISYKTLKPGPDWILSGDFNLQMIAEAEIDGDYFIRISKVI